MSGLQLNFNRGAQVDPYKGISDALGSNGGIARMLMARDAKIAADKAAADRAKEILSNREFQMNQNALNREQQLTLSNNQIDAANLRHAESIDQMRESEANRERQRGFERGQIYLNDQADAAAERTKQALLSTPNYTTTEEVSTVAGPDGSALRTFRNDGEALRNLDNLGSQAGNEYNAIEKKAQALGYGRNADGSYALPSNDALKLAFNKKMGYGNTSLIQDVKGVAGEAGQTMLRLPTLAPRVVSTAAKDAYDTVNMTENEKLQAALNPKAEPKGPMTFEDYKAQQQADVDKLNESLSRFYNRYDDRGLLKNDKVAQDVTATAEKKNYMSDTEYAGLAKNMVDEQIANYKKNHKGRISNRVETRIRKAANTQVDKLVAERKASETASAALKGKITYEAAVKSIDAKIKAAQGQEKQEFELEKLALENEFKKQQELFKQSTKYDMAHKDDWF